MCVGSSRSTNWLLRWMTSNTPVASASDKARKHNTMAPNPQIKLPSVHSVGSACT